MIACNIVDIAVLVVAVIVVLVIITTVVLLIIIIYTDLHLSLLIVFLFTPIIEYLNPKFLAICDIG